MESSPRGYSLLELIVAIGLFSFVILIVMATYLAIIDYDRRARATNEIVSSLSFALESMIRTIRTGTGYTCSGNPCSTISFVDATGGQVTYRLKGDGTIGQCTTGSCSDGLTHSLTDPRITIQDLDFYVSGTGSGDDLQPRVTALVRGRMPAERERTVDFAIQMGATQRLLDI